MGTGDNLVRSYRSSTVIIKCAVCGSGTARVGFLRPHPKMCVSCGHTFSDREIDNAYVMVKSRHDIVLPRYQYQKHGKKWILKEVEYPFPVGNYPAWRKY